MHAENAPPNAPRPELERSLERLERLVMLATSIRREYPDTKRRDAIGGAVLLLRIDDDCEAHGLPPAFTLEHVERALGADGCACPDCRFAPTEAR